MNHRDFWYATYTLYSVSETVENEERVSDAASGSSGGDQGSSNRQLTMVSFLKPVLKQIIMAGKSMQLLKNLDCKEAELPNGSPRGQCFFIFLLYKSFVQLVWLVCVFLFIKKNVYCETQMQKERVCIRSFWSRYSLASAARRSHPQTL